jgi:hypothetical protein
VKRVFLLHGFAPAAGEGVNKFLRSCDLGVEGAFTEEILRITLTVCPVVTRRQLDRQPELIKEAYEQMGWCDINITEILFDA